MPKQPKPGRPVIFGEVLFDQFPDGSKVLGGAPFNVAWHLRGFGLNPLLASRIGSDDAGQEVLMRMRDWGLAVQGIQIDTEYPTGVVQIELQQGQPVYSIVADQAYDFISYALLKSCIGQQAISFIYHGSLATRSAISRATLKQIIDGCRALRFIDINLRTPWWDKQSIDKLIGDAYWLKLNDQELAELTGMDSIDAQEREAEASLLLGQYSLETLVLTEGERGACIISQSDTVCGASAAVENVQDTVGAGDAFSAVCLLGYSQGWADEIILKRALEFAANICEFRGATPDDSQLYSDYLMRWMNHS
ncbi:MAG TPA: carbohydrate kinase [Gammaproteobacteria bacterium]|nr:carbohydrate kinase [Gammaproteobacteria bacterium]